MVPKPENSTNSEIRDGLPLTSGFKVYPPYRDDKLKNPQLWMKGKIEADAAYPYWRVHDKLYDLTSFIDKHPGGKFWIESTQGSDITELFESSHFGPIPENILSKYFIKNASTPRNSPFTFEYNGFFKTLKRKVTPILEKVGRGPTKTSLLIQDSLLMGFLVCFFLAAYYDAILFIIPASMFLSFSCASSHNFFHQKDNWRMYIFDMMLFSSTDWRISHIYSHHIFPNTIYDYEISSFEPFIEIMPRFTKSYFYGIFATLNAQIIALLGFWIEFISKYVLIFKKMIKPSVMDMLPLIQMIALILINGSASRGFLLWIALHSTASFFFLFIGLTVAHHHPKIYHEGDAVYKDRDWALHQIAATRDRGEVISNLVLVSISFGNHTLHHLFPTVDHSKLPHLMPAFLETCKEFDVKFDICTIWELFKGFYSQMARNTPNTNVSNCLSKIQ